MHDSSAAGASASDGLSGGRQGRRRSRWRMGLWIVLALVVALAAVWAWRHFNQPLAGEAPAGGPSDSAPAAGPGAGRGPATTVGVATAERADVPVLLEALGTVAPLATVRVRPQVSGVLEKVFFQEGQRVRRGQLLAQIDPRQFEASLQQALGQRLRDEAQLEAARVTLARYQTLLSQDSIARQEVDTQAALVKQVEAAVVVSRANESTARLNLGYTRIAAPLSGRVGLRTVDVGNVVNPSDADGVAIITQLAPIDVEFSVPQDHAGSLQRKSGDAMAVQALDRTRTTLLDSGVFASLDNQIDAQTGTVRAKARFANAQSQLFPNQFVNVRLQLDVLKNTVVVPVAAVRHGGSGDYVFVLQDDRSVRLRNVVRGQPMGERVQLVSGLQVGERVITDGVDRLRDGAKVVLQGDAPPARRDGASAARRRP